MEKLYTVNSSKVFDETIGNDAEHHYKGFEFNDVYVFGEKMHVFFCKNEKGIFVIAGKLRKGQAYRGADHRWHSGRLYYDIYYRKNFKSKEEGNKFYKEVKTRREITEMKAKALTYEELMKLAREHYNEGGDQTYECWDEKRFNMYVEMFGPMTKKRALEMFRLDKEVYDDIASTAW